MLLNNLKIEENPPGPADTRISAEVVIKRDGRHYSIKIRKELKYTDGRKYFKCMAEFHDLIMQFYRECEKITELHIPVPKGQFIDEYGREIYDEVFIFNLNYLL